MNVLLVGDGRRWHIKDYLEIYKRYTPFEPYRSENGILSDLGLEYRTRQMTAVTIDAAEATVKYGVAVKVPPYAKCPESRGV